MHNLWLGIQEGWWMLYHTFWALVLGFTLSGIVQAFISRKSMESVLGKRDAKSVGRASFFGVISSSCSYAASALARSIFLKGADFTTSMIFMFASTNLVIELGIVLWLMVGWQFALAEFVGGSIMILLLWKILPRFVPQKLIEKVIADDHAANGTNPAFLSNAMSSNMGSNISMLSMAGESMKEESSGGCGPDCQCGSDQNKKEKSRWLLKKNWASAAGYTMGDFIMLRKELIIGFLVAGIASIAVPFSWWQSLFLSGHGALSAIENAIIGPVLAFISFVCSVGNVPLAAALWHGGITFGGVIAFIFADLLAFPLVMIYRKYYGNQLALRLSLVFWFVMSASGLITEIIFQALGLIPGAHHHEMSMNHVGMNYTTVLNVLFLCILAIVYFLYKSRPADANSEFAQDPICGMQVRKDDAPAQWEFEGVVYYFCMQGCKDEFMKQKTA